MLSLFLIVVPIALLLPSTITNEVKDDLEDKIELAERVAQPGLRILAL